MLAPLPPPANAVLEGDNLPLLRALADGCAQLAYLDPPFNTGRRQTRRSLALTASESGERTGFGGRRYASRLLAQSSFPDAFEDYLAFLEPRLREVRRVLDATGTLYFHILVYVRDPARYHFDAEAVEREPYMAPGLVGAERAARGKLPTSVLWHTIVSPTGREKSGYPTQKPEALLRRFVQASSRPGDLCLDPFAGSGTLGAVAAALGRRYVLMDDNPEAVRVMRRRLEGSLAA